MPDIKITPLTLKLLKVFTDNPNHDLYGLELSRTLGKPYGSILPLLIRLEKAGWLRSEFENIDPVEHGRPKRKYYQLTSEGKVNAKNNLEEETKFWSRRVVLT